MGAVHDALERGGDALVLGARAPHGGRRDHVRLSTARRLAPVGLDCLFAPEALQEKKKKVFLQTQQTGDPEELAATGGSCAVALSARTRSLNRPKTLSDYRVC